MAISKVITNESRNVLISNLEYGQPSMRHVSCRLSQRRQNELMSWKNMLASVKVELQNFDLWGERQRKDRERKAQEAHRDIK
jgi:hypothetical protein